MGFFVQCRAHHLVLSFLCEFSCSGVPAWDGERREELEPAVKGEMNPGDVAQQVELLPGMPVPAATPILKVLG